MDPLGHDRRAPWWARGWLAGRRRRRSIAGTVVVALVATVFGIPDSREANARALQIFKVPRVTGDLRAGMETLEQEARTQLVEQHRLPSGLGDVGIVGATDQEARLNDWGRAEMRAAIWVRLVEIIRTAPSERTGQERALYDWFREEVRKRRLKSAEQARAQYDFWNRDPCTYRPPGPFSYSTPTSCASVLGQVFGGPSPPSVEEFESYGAYLALENSPLSTDPDAEEVSAEGAFAIVAIAAIPLAATISAAAVAASTAVATKIVTAVFPFAIRAGVAVAGAAAGAIAGAVTIVLAAIVIGVIRGIQVFNDAEVPKKLDRGIEAARGAPDLAAMLGDTEDIQLMYGVFIEHTLPDRPVEEPVDGQIVVGLTDFLSPDRPRQLTQAPALPGDARFTLQRRGTTATSEELEFASKTWGESDRKEQETGMDQGWFVHEYGKDGRELSLRLNYLNWSGEQWTAWVSGDTFVHLRDTVSYAEGKTCAEIDGCEESPQIDFTKPDGSHWSASLNVNRAPIVDPAVIGDKVEGHALLFKANGYDPDGDSVTYDWEFQVSCGNFTVSEECGRTRPDQLTLVPFDACDFTLLPCSPSTKPVGHEKPARPVPVGAVKQGPEVRHAFVDDGTYLVYLTATDFLGKYRTTQITVHVANGRPVIKTETVTPVLEGSAARLRGAIEDPGDDAVTLTIDWGDGTSSTMYVGESHWDERGQLTLGGPICIGPCPPTLQRRSGGFTFDITHTYADDPPGAASTYEVKLAARDDGDTPGVASVPVGVTNVAPTADLTFEPAQLDEGEAVKVSGTITDPGVEDTFTVTFPDGGHPPVQVGAATRVCPQLVLSSCTYDPPQFEAIVPVLDDGPGDEAAILRVAVTDDDGGVSRSATPLDVRNVAPSVQVSVADPTIDEGSDGSVAVTVTDPGADAVELEIDWGDGTVEPVPLGRRRSHSASHRFVDDGDFTVKVVGTDDDGGRGEDSASITVENLAPELTASIPASLVEGESATVSGTVSDTGADDVVTVHIDWGDGTGGPVTVENGAFSELHRYVDEGSFTVTVTADDGDGGVVERSGDLRVANADPILGVTMPAGATEGERVVVSGTAVDPGPGDEVRVRVDFGDGTVVTPAVDDRGAFSVGHVYRDDGSFTVRVDADDGDGGAAQRSAPLGVSNAPPTLTASLPAAVSEGDSGVLSAEVGDPGPDDVVALEVDWGDGATAKVDAASGAVSLSHVFGDEGSFTVRVVAVDDDGARTEWSETVSVGNAAPAVTIDRVVDVGRTDEGLRVRVDASFHDPGEGDVTTAAVDWGDGSSSGGGVVGASESFEHTFASPGVYTVVVRATDDGGGTAEARATVTVAEPENVVPLARPGQRFQGSPPPVRVENPDAGAGEEVVVAVDPAPEGAPARVLLADCDGNGTFEVGPVPGASVSCPAPVKGATELSVALVTDGAPPVRFVTSVGDSGESVAGALLRILALLALLGALSGAVAVTLRRRPQAAG